MNASGTQILEWVQQFPMQILQFFSDPIWKYQVVRTDLICCNQGCSDISE